MQLRRDPITQSWVILEDNEAGWPDLDECPLCPGHEALCPKQVYEYPFGNATWEVRVVPHVRPLYRIEGDPQRRAEGVYDRMRNVGAHEVVVESQDHNLTLSQLSDTNVAQVIRAFVSRISELKKDPRFRYVAVFRNQGALAGQDLAHPHSEIAATPFIPRRIGYELRSAQRHYKQKERCIFCDMLQQEMTRKARTIEYDELFLTFCPFASRVPYETWVMPINHHCAFEEDIATWDRQLHLARTLKSILRRLESVASAYHMVIHTCPNLTAKYERLDNWKTIADDYHWHIEILPVIPTRSKSYSVKEVYYNSLAPEVAAEELRSIAVATEYP